MSAERFWHWLGVATIADLNELSRQNEERRSQIGWLRHIAIPPMETRLQLMERRLGPQMTKEQAEAFLKRQPRVQLTDDGEPKTARTTTPTCESTDESERN